MKLNHNNYTNISQIRANVIFIIPLGIFLKFINYQIEKILNSLLSKTKLY